MRSTPALLGVCSLALLLGATVLDAATIEIDFTDANGVGFHDATFRVFAPNNSSLTLGGQRQNVVRAAAAYWENVLDSDVTIRVSLSMPELQPCTASGGLLGHAGPKTAVRDYPGAPIAATYFPIAEASSHAGFDLDAAQPDIIGEFNSLVDGDATCFTSAEWWYGLGVPVPAGKFDFYRVVLHEIGHGLGVLTFVDVATGLKPYGYDDAFMRNLEDHSTQKTWPQMTNAERVASAKDTGDLHWIGGRANALGGLTSSGLGSGGHPKMYAPASLELGSSVSHWAKEIAPNELMEPALNNDALDYLTLGLLQDIGWQVSLLFESDFESGNTSGWMVP